MLDGVKKGKEIKQLQMEFWSHVDVYKYSEEFGEVRAFHFMEEFRHGDSQVKQSFPQYSIDFGSFPLPNDIMEALNQVALREEGYQVNQEGQGKGGDGGN